MQNIRNGVGALIIRDDKILLAERTGSHGENTFGSVGGHIEYGETPLQALIREGQEELGIILGEFEFLTCINLLYYGRHAINITFIANIVEGEPMIHEPDKIKSCHWYSLNDLPNPLFEPIIIAINSLNNGKRYVEYSDKI